MSFVRPKIEGRFSISYYLLGFGIVLFAFALLGQLPLIVGLFSLTHIPTIDTLDLLKSKVGENAFLILLTSPFVFGFFGLYFAQRVVHGTKWLIQFTAKSAFRYKRMFVAAGIWLGISVGSTTVSYLVGGQFIWLGFSTNNLVLLFVSIVFIGIQTASEELFFRGYLLQALGRFIQNNSVIVLLSGTVFGLVHGWNPEVQTLGPFALTYYVWTGLFLGFIAVLDDGLELTIGYHFANNFFAAYCVTNDWQAFQTPALIKDLNPPYFDWMTLIYLIFTQLLFAIILLRKEQWKSVSNVFLKK